MTTVAPFRAGLCLRLRAWRTPAWLAVLVAGLVAGLPTVQAAVRLTEILAENDGGLRDRDGQTPDWIELFNDSPSPVNLGGWRLTDSPTNLTKWTFPATNLASGGLLVVFASGKDRAVAGAELHTNFRLEQSGGYVALVRPDGVTIEDVLNYPEQRVNVSYGLGVSNIVATVLPTNAAVRYFIPGSGALGGAWTGLAFNDSGWSNATAPVAYTAGSLPGVPVLSVDFNDDDSGEAGAANTESGFSSMALTNNPATFGGITVQVSAINGGALDDRDRATPAQGGNLTLDQIYDDFIFVIGQTNGNGARLQIAGLAPLQNYQLTIWSFDSSSVGARVSDWVETASGVTRVITNGYVFDGGVLPTRDTDSTIQGQVQASAGGALTIEGQRTGGTSHGIFLNGLRLAPLGATAPTGNLAALYGSNATVYLRTPFTLANPAGISSLTLRVRYNDGFVAYINGTLVASRNAPASPQWNSTATATHSAALAEDILIIPPPGLLVAGTNVLAVQGLNIDASDADFTFAPELIAQQTTEFPGRYFQPSSPAANNAGGFVGLVADTRFSADRGFYSQSFFLSITTATAGAQIRWTTNGSPPSLTNGFLYTSPIPITRLSHIRAAAFRTGYVPSDIDTHTYLFMRDILRQSNSIPGYPVTWQGSYPADYEIDSNLVNHVTYGPTLSNDLRSIPVLSIVTEFDGLWGPVRGIYNHATSLHDPAAGQDWERAASVELIRADGTNNITEFAVNCAIRMHGNASRDNARTPKHNIRLLFSSDYGPSKLRYDWFPGPVNEFDNIILRADGFVDAWPSRYSDTTTYTDTVTGQSWLGQRYRPETGTYLRDTFAKETQRAMGWTGSRSSWVHLYLNGLYWGLYNPIERLDASFMSQHLGGWESDWDVIVYDDPTAVVVATDGTKTDWTSLMSQLGAGVAGDPAYQAIAAQVDIDNVIDYFILHFFIESEDWPHHNWYAAHRRANSTNGLPATKWQIFTWDQEVSLDRIVRRDRTAVNNFDTPAYIYSQLRANAEFRRQFGDRVHRHFFNDGALTLSNNVSRFAALAAAITNAIVGESARWGDAREFAIGSNPGTGVTFTRNEWWVPELHKLWTNFFPRLTADNIARLRTAGLYPTVGGVAFSQFGGAVSNGFTLVLTHTNVGGVIYYTADGSDPRAYGTGAVAPSAQGYGAPIPINAPTLVRARVLLAGSWSALTEAVFYPPQDLSRLALTEIMYNPPAVGLTNGDDFEFIELKNTGTNTLNLSGLNFGGVGFAFTNGTLLAPGAFCVLVRNPISFASKYPGVTPHGIYSGSLNNAGESLSLNHALGTTVFSVTYDDDLPWPVTADAFGFSLVPRNPGASQAPDQGTDWRASTWPGGSPGADDPAPTVPGIVINEVLTHSDPAPPTDTIELFNPTAGTVNLGGWYLTDDRSVPWKFRIPDNTFLAAGAYVSFNELNFNTTPGTNGSFSLSSHGESVHLFSATAGGQLTGYSHGFDFGAAPSGVSFGRHVNSVGTESFPAQLARTFNAANAGPVVGPVVLGEIHYNPAPGGDEFIELQNITGAPVALFEPANPAAGWRLSGLNYNFPTNTVLAPNGLLLLVATNPADFRAKYSVPVQVPILGPWAGSLQNSGERLALERPDVPDTNGSGWIVVDAVRYNDKAPWPPAADGGGSSLQRLAAAAYADDPANWTAAGPTPGQSLAVTDTDGDGMPDAWEQAHGTQPFIPDAGEDPDGDGSTNLQEYLAGTHPNDPGSVLRIDAILLNEGLVTIQFTAVSNRTYTVLSRDNLGGGPWQTVTNVPALPVTTTLQVTRPVSGPVRFLRVATP